MGSARPTSGSGSSATTSRARARRCSTGSRGGSSASAITYDRLIPRDLGRPFEAVFEGCARGGFRGINVTYPYKERAARMVRTRDPAVAALGAVNTVVFGEDGPEGFNTDRSGFVGATAACAATPRPGSSA